MAIRLIVKGTHQDAVRAALAHGFVSANPWRIREISGSVYMDAQIDPTLTGEDETERANAWYTETIHAPFPPGALLFWGPDADTVYNAAQTFNLTPKD